MRDVRAAEAAVFWWWDDAVREAVARGVLTRRKFHVTAYAGMWRIEPLDAAFCTGVSEVCS